MNDEDIKLAEKAIETTVVDHQFQIDELKREIYSLRKTLEEYGITKEEVSPISEIEFICISQIERLGKIAQIMVLEEEEVKKLDLFHKNLRMARGEMAKKEPKGKQESVENLLKLVRGES
jgi:hypothetical protein